MKTNSFSPELFPLFASDDVYDFRDHLFDFLRTTLERRLDVKDRSDAAFVAVLLGSVCGLFDLFFSSETEILSSEILNYYKSIDAL